MAIEQGTQFIGISPDVNLTEKKSTITNDQTAVYTVDDIRGYKVYTALLTQTGTDDPVAIVLENTIGDIIWSYINTGEYVGTLTGAFTTDKTAGFLGSNLTLPGQKGMLNIANTDINSINVQTFDIDNLSSNDILYYTFLEVRVYN